LAYVWRHRGREGVGGCEREWAKQGLGKGVGWGGCACVRSRVCEVSLIPGPRCRTM